MMEPPSSVHLLFQGRKNSREPAGKKISGIPPFKNLTYIPLMEKDFIIFPATFKGNMMLVRVFSEFKTILLTLTSFCVTPDFFLKT